ncbi:MAG: PD-(D/E)XK nuclease family protein [Sulfurisoma sp.]|nr:PD-(D/E)XK nuclease family protein [Sulfurisoma sp.]
MAEFLRGLGALDGIERPAVILCATHRLTRELRLAHGRAQAAAGQVRWAALETATVSQWCGAVLREALLSGALPVGAAPRLVLSPMQERVLWERVIADDGAADEQTDFYDRAGLAGAAAEANALTEAWRLQLGADAAGSAETVRFIAWREAFRRRCAEHGWLEPVRGLDWQVEALARGAGRMPATVVFAGFDRLPPQEARLARVLAERGARVVDLRLEAEAPGQAQAVALPDRAAECRAAAAWAAQRLNEQPDSRIGIVVPELAALRETLNDALDECLQPSALNPAQADAPRRHAFAVGVPLVREPLVQVALERVTFAANPGRTEQARLGELLRGAFWSSEMETDARHRIEALMREKLAPEITLERLLRLARRAALDEVGAIAAPRLIADLERLAGWRSGNGGRQAPSIWAERYAELLAAVGWPGERATTAREIEAHAAFNEMLDGLGTLDAVLGKVGAGDTANRLRKLCAERMFQPEPAGQAQVSVMGPLEPAAAPFDALWVMGMNEHLWPPAARPNPLLPADLQRRAGMPDASAEVQVALARAVHERLLHGATEVVFSFAQADSGRELRPSPLLAGIARAEPRVMAPGLVAAQAGAAMEKLFDAKAPEVAAGEKVRGGTGLLRAQAVCPAWAFYQCRLGARALAEPVEGLDAAGRGTLLHAVLEAFWKDRGSAELAAMNAAARAAAIGFAVGAGLVAFDAQREDPLPARFVELERERLARLVAQWLDLEAKRTVPFSVVARELELTVEIEGIAVRLVIDRIDALDDGRLLIIDYKTGSKVSAESWGAERVTELQLPIYAAHAGEAAGGEVVGVALAKVRLDECGFAGIAAEGGLLPKVAGIGEDAARKVFPDVASWPELLAAWKENIDIIAREVGEGVAAVCFEDARDLEYCEVLPLLRLAERKTQMESGDD